MAAVVGSQKEARWHGMRAAVDRLGDAVTCLAVAQSYCGELIQITKKQLLMMVRAELRKRGLMEEIYAK